MIDSIMPTLTERINEAEKINARIAELLKGNYSDERRLTLILAYLNLSLDHHSAIILLMRNGSYGSAMALVRVLFEAMIKAHWVAKCASEDQVNAIAEKDADVFPNMAAMAEAVDRAFSDPSDQPLDFFQQAKKDAWKATNSYTHSGLLQLGRQFSGSRVEAKYPEEALVSGINASTASAVMLGYLLANATGKASEATEIAKMFDFGK